MWGRRTVAALLATLLAGCQVGADGGGGPGSLNARVGGQFVVQIGGPGR